VAGAEVSRIAFPISRTSRLIKSGPRLSFIRPWLSLSGYVTQGIFNKTPDLDVGEPIETMAPAATCMHHALIM